MAVQNCGPSPDTHPRTDVHAHTHAGAYADTHGHTHADAYGFCHREANGHAHCDADRHANGDTYGRVAYLSPLATDHCEIKLCLRVALRRVRGLATSVSLGRGT